MKQINLLATILILFTASIFAQTNWTIDKSHSKIGFNVTHMVVAEVDGKFNSYEGVITSDGENFETVKIDLKIDANSINTNNERRDGHLKGDDFFSAEKFPYITFVSKKMVKVDDKNWKLYGDFTIRDVTKEIVLDTRFNGFIKDNSGNTRAGFKLKGEINRFDYKLSWNAAIEAGGLVVSEDVEFDINIELIKK